MATKSRLLGDGCAHGLGGGSSVVVSATPKRGAHYYDATGLCACGVRRRLVDGRYEYQTAAGWALGEPVCSVVWQ